MYITTKRLQNAEWQKVDEVNDGNSYLLQNISDVECKYIVTESAPEDSAPGMFLLPRQQLAFKKITGELYLKKSGYYAEVSIEKVEEA